MRTRIAYLILHYNTDDETYTCVESIRKLSKSPIVIVCNGSNNKTDKKVEEKYAADPSITVILSSENLGFAQGNNLGISYIRDNNIAEIIVCINNDIIMTHGNFEKEVIREFETSKYAIGGVDVLNPQGVHCSPNYEKYPTNETVDRSIRKFERAVTRCSIFFGIGEILYAGWKRILSRRVKPAKSEKMIMTLHGCCLIFTPEFFSVYDGLCPDTFLYGEEVILSYQCDIKGLIVKYISTTQVLHNESKATKKEYTKLIQRHLFYYKNILESTKVLKKIITK